MKKNEPLLHGPGSKGRKKINVCFKIGVETLLQNGSANGEFRKAIFINRRKK